MKRIWVLVAGVVLVLGLGVGLVLGTGKNVQNPVDNGEINTDINDGTEEQDEALIVNDDESDFVFEYMTLDEFNDWEMSYYEGDEDIAIIVGVKDNAMKSNVVIPSFVVYNDETYRVGAIDEYAFAINVRSEFVHIDYLDGEEWEGEQTVWDNNETIKTVTIPATLDFVEQNAFRGCVAVEKIYLKERSTPIYNSSLWNLSEELVAKELNISLDEFWHESGNGQNEDNIKDAYGSVYNSLFNKDPSEPNLYYLGDKNKPYSYLCMYYDPSFDWNEEWGGLDDFSATVNSGCKVIGDYAFNSYPLTGVTLPSGLKVLGESAFGCTKLTSVSIPSSVTIIDWCTFDSCEALLEVTFEEYSQLKIIQGEAFYYCTSLETIELPEGVKEISDSIFYGCENLTSITIPNSVTSIGENAFEECYSLEEIAVYGELLEECEISSFLDSSILTKVTILGDIVPYGALCGCSSLESVTLPFVGASADATEASETTLFGYVFGDTYYDGSVEVEQFYGIDEVESRSATYYIPENLTDVTILGGNIPYGTFSNCSGLTSVTISASVTSMGSRVFSGCSNLQNVTLPFVGASADATTYSESTFFGYVFGNISYDGAVCVTQGQSDDFSVWDSFYIPLSLAKVTIYGGPIMYGAFYGCYMINEIIVGDNVSRIESFAFYECRSLIKVTIGSGVKSIGGEAFGWCWDLTTIIFSEGSQLESVEDYAFDTYADITITIPSLEMWLNISFGGHFATLHLYIGENEITELIIPNGITEIKNGAFSGCSGLTSVTIPSSVTSIGERAFWGCSLTKVTIDNLESWLNISFGGTGSGPLDEAHHLYIGNNEVTQLVIPEGTTEIKDYAFSGCGSITSITIPNSVTSIGNSAFSGCTSLTSITVPDSVTSIGEFAFSGCRNLTSVTIGSSVVNIRTNAFLGCYVLVEIYNKSDLNLTKGSSDYGGIARYAEVVYSGDTINTPTKIEGIDGVAYYKESETSYIALRCEDKTKTLISIDSRTTKIKEYAFSGCRSLTSITVPDSVTSIGEFAFSGCSSLESMILPFVGGSVKKPIDTYQYPFGYIFGSSAYDGSTGVIQQYHRSDTYNFTNTTYHIPSSLRSVTITGGYILYGAFDGCSMLTSITLPNDITFIQSHAFNYCTSLTSITIPNSVTSIGDYAFSHCSSLTSVIIGNGVTNIGERVFSGCSSLTSISIPNSVTRIGNSAFYGCSSLTSITIPNSVTSIGTNVFYNCSSLTNVTFENPNGWFVADSSTATSGTEVTLTDPSTNATYLKTTYYNKYWKRSA